MVISWYARAEIRQITPLVPSERLIPGPDYRVEADQQVDTAPGLAVPECMPIAFRRASWDGYEYLR